MSNQQEQKAEAIRLANELIAGFQPPRKYTTLLRRVAIYFLLPIGAYSVAYFFAPWRSPARNMVICRFDSLFECRAFWPAGWLESKARRIYVDFRFREGSKPEQFDHLFEP